MKILWKGTLLLWAAMAACNPQSTNTPEAPTAADSEVTEVIKDSMPVARLQAEAFTPPSVIEGCTALFAQDSAGLRQQAYLFAANINGPAFVKLNGQLHQLQLQHKNNNAENIEETYTANGITVTLTATPHQRSGDEVWLYRGTLIIQNKGEQITIPVWGEIGC